MKTSTKKETNKQKIIPELKNTTVEIKKKTEEINRLEDAEE